MLLALKIGAVLFGAAWRFWDGLSREDAKIAAAWRGTVFSFAALGVCLLTGKPWPLALWMASAATLNITVGHTEWKDWQWQALRFGAVAALTVLPLNDFASTGYYVAACMAGGLAYPALFALDKWLPRWWLFDGPEAYARLPLGAAILGGLAFL